MADFYGAETLPVATPSTGATVSDKALDTIGAWLKAVITAECATAWASVAPNETIVRTLQTQDPGGQDFSENQLPALFVFRSQSQLQHWEDGNWGAESTVTCLYVFPPGEQTKHARRLAIFSGLQKAVHRALGPNNGRHPSWVVAGDTDPYAAAYGSSLLTQASLRWVKLNPFFTADVTIPPMTDSYDAIKFELLIREDYYQGDSGIETSDVRSTITSNRAYVGVTEQKR